MSYTKKEDAASVKLESVKQMARDFGRRLSRKHAAALTETAVEEFYKAIGSPYALQLLELYQQHQFAEIVRYPMPDPSDTERYPTGESYRLDFVAWSFLRKCGFLNTGINTREAALQSWYKAEQQCLSTNRRLRRLFANPQTDLRNFQRLEALRRKIAFILQRFSGEEFFDSSAWGPGVSQSVKGSDTSAVRKFREEREITTKLYELVGPFLSTAYPNWDLPENGLRFVESSKFDTVPKNAKTDRCIAIEPGLNIWFQKSLGKMLRRRVGRYGYDLDHDTRSHLLCREGAHRGLIATVDFSAASDTIAKELVRYVLPPDWFAVMDACRTHTLVFDNDLVSGHPYVLEKFSSMGNGFTWELESLIFMAAAEVVTEEAGLGSDAIAVFGDDITLYSAVYDQYRDFTAFLGFTINEEKSFATGEFRESCGVYYHGNVDCKPYYLTERLSSYEEVIKFANAIRTLAHRFGGGMYCDRRFQRLWLFCRDSIPADIQFTGPLGYGDGYLIVNFDEAKSVTLSSRFPFNKRGWEGFLVRCFFRHPVKGETDSPAVLTARLHSRSLDRAAGNEYDLRQVTRVVVKRLLVQQWYNLGPWY